MAIHLPEAAQELMRRLRRRNETVLIALRIADMYAFAAPKNIAHLLSRSPSPRRNPRL
ncbi:MAG: hypothetical protein IPI21_16535 [Propionivibrio sp.]|nr:hypothetical protein [Propionivibrio sp.]